MILQPVAYVQYIQVLYRKDKHIFRDKLVLRLTVQKVYPFFITVICIGICSTNPQEVNQALPFY